MNEFDLEITDQRSFYNGIALLKKRRNDIDVHWTINLRSEVARFKKYGIHYAIKSVYLFRVKRYELFN